MRVWPVLPVVGLLVSTLSACDTAGRTYSTGANDVYVAIGDSYTAAPRTGFPDGDDGCHRSERNYPHLVADVTGADLHDVSCSGASTTQLTEPWKPGGVHLVAPQLDALNDQTDLVTVGIGANDFHLIGIVFLTCPALAVKEPDADSPCTDAAKANPNASLKDLLSQMEDNVTERLQDVTDLAPNADVLVIGYPSIIPAHGTCDELPLAPGDYPLARRIIDGINASVAAAADRAGVEFVDTATGSEGHDICSDDPWIAGAHVKEGHAAPLHPYPEEQEFVSRQVLDAIG
jgi:lysophospholipase L1-like esterase